MSIPFTRAIKVTTTTRLENKIGDVALGIMRKRIENSKKVARDIVRDMYLTAIRKTEVFRGLSGVFSGYKNGNDLQAEFGLSSSDATVAAQEIIKILDEIISEPKTIQSIETIGDRSKIILRAHLPTNEDYKDPLLTGNAFSYSSHGIVIPWMQWLLEAARDIPAQTVPSIVDYGITYNLSESEEESSRSGRAVMARVELGRNRPIKSSQGTNEGGFHYYVLPLICIPMVSGSENFIDDISLSKHFKKILADEIEAEVKKIMQPRAR